MKKSFQPKKVWGKYAAESMLHRNVGGEDANNGRDGRGGRHLKLEADLFLETESGAVVMAFAPFAEGMKKWKQQALLLAPGLAWWQKMKKEAVRCWVVFPIEGQAVKVDF